MTSPSPERVSFATLGQAEWRSLLGHLRQRGLESLNHPPVIPPRPADTHTAPRRYDPPRTIKQDSR